MYSFIRTTILAALLATLAQSQGRPVTPADQTAGQSWWAHIQALADDSMQGRLTGSDGYLRAARYVVSQFDAAGLQPAGSNSYYQPVKFDVSRVLADKSSVSLLTAGRTEPLVLGHDAILGARGVQPKSVTAPLVFIGYGLHLPEAKYDDFDSPEMPLASIKGKIVVYINGGPADLPGPLKSFARTSPLEKALADAGAVGSISIPTPKSMDFPWDRVAANASQPGMRLAADPKDAAIAARHPALASLHRTMFTAQFNPAEAEKLFAGSGHTFGDLLALADAQKPLPRFDLKKSLTASVTTENTSVDSPNIVAKLEGSDPKLKQEYILVSAHLDHLGTGAPTNGRTVFAGAMDDASGVASVLEIAKSFSQNPVRPKRSMLFVIFTGEEKGLLGSKYFAGRPTVPETDVVADFNLDMFMPIFALKKLHVQGLAESTLGDEARAVGAEHHIEIANDPEPDRNSFTRTDQYSFVLAGVPALAMKFGWTMGSPEYKAWRQWLAQRYHSMEDNLTQPVDKAAAGQFNSFLADLARRVANNPGRPHYAESSFFHRFEQ
jgi:Zn-dependent M28 family amino/carboxypeptidase